MFIITLKTFTTLMAVNRVEMESQWYKVAGMKTGLELQKLAVFIDELRRGQD